MIAEFLETPAPVGFFEIDLINYALATVVIEVPIFYICGFRQTKDAIFFACVNIISNLLLNEFLQATSTDNITIFIGEIFVVALEFVLCSYWIKAHEKLLKTLILTNISSFLLGMIYFLFC